MQWLNVLETFGVDLLGPTVWLVLWTLVKILVIAVPIILCVAYLTYCDYIGRCLWRDRCRLGFQFKICILSCDARFGANAVLRVGDRICVGDCAVSVGQLEYD